MAIDRAIKRRGDWRSRLSAAIEAKRREPAAFGTNDCAIFVASCVAAMTGIDLAARFRGRYATAEEAVALIRAAGHGDLCELVASFFEEIAPPFVRIGDVAAFPATTAGWALGIVTGERVTVLRPDGLGTLPLTDIARAFRVP